jgi:hypothetical protein
MPVMYRGIALDQQTADADRAAIMQSGDLALKSRYKHTMANPSLAIKISFGCTRDFRVKMWATSLPEDRLAGNLGNVIEATSIGGRRSDFFTAGKLAPGSLGLFQQHRS